ncbi:unnamed protein product (macronuclear) [Paramecium tetraurelia]|uniref:Uncharacterized protein n=1 Tax=Paramecium tetraurelia TaxID=5888 RepID=A0BCF5_PARTE|nr:uncharacterized protein GSPATT00004316001 [Paramecium tetraurelia]CAK56222.1 unnamed protein product [Paramecium tetraurelia]|eukprot:XP_001423620.1 hypothetical protein (macronuclear) [Paramecium tetraurelia strain d4-2]
MNKTNNSIKDLQLRLLISESEKQVAVQKLNDLKRSERTKPSLSLFAPSKDQAKRKDKVGKLLIDLMNLIATNNSLQCMLEINSLENMMKIFDQGKCYKLLKKIIKPFTLLITYLLNTNITETLSVRSENQTLQHLSNYNSVQAGIQTPMSQVITINSNNMHNHKTSFPSSIAFKPPSEATTPEKSVKQAPISQPQQKQTISQHKGIGKTQKPVSRRTATTRMNTCGD